MHMSKLKEMEPITVLENKTIGRNISMYRKIRDIKAGDIAKQLGIKEATYTKYERGETALTINFIQQVAEVLKVDPLMLLSVHPGTFIDSGNNSPGACISNNGYFNHQTVDQNQSQMMMKLMESVMDLNQRLVEILDENRKLKK